MLSSKPQVNHQTVSETAKKLMPAYSDNESEDPQEDILDADEEASDADEEKLAEVAFAATKRRDLDKRRLREARVVDPVVGEENIHAAPGDEEITQKEMMQRMLNALGKTGDGDKGRAMAELEKKVARLHTHGKKELSVPLPAPVQGRIERAAAYDQVKQLVSDKWNDAVKSNRRAKRLVFPLNGEGVRVGRNTSDIAGNFQPMNQYEDEIQKILVEAGVASEKQVRHGEEKAIDDLGVSEVTKEEVLERRRQMAKMRSLMFHYERKMKRIKRIKSKKFRRVMKKEREKLVGMMDSEEEEEALMKAERERAEERMTLRHKNTSKWVRRQLKRGETKRNLNTRAAIEEQLRLHDELKKKQGVTNDSDESDGEDGEETEEALQKQLNDIQTELLQNEAPKKQKGIMGMRFMQAAQERQRKEALALLKEMKTGGEQYDSDDEVRMKGRQFFNREERFTAVPDNAGSEERRQPGLQENSDHDDDEAIDELQKHVEEAYVESGNAIEEGKAIPGDTLDDIQEVLQKANRPSGFTSKLSGRLSVDNNPWLRGKSSGRIKELKASEDLDEEESCGTRDSHGVGLDETSIEKQHIQTASQSSRGKQKVNQTPIERHVKEKAPSKITKDGVISVSQSSNQTVLRIANTPEAQSGTALGAQTRDQDRVGLLKQVIRRSQGETSAEPRHSKTDAVKVSESRDETTAVKSTSKNKRKRVRSTAHAENGEVDETRSSLDGTKPPNNPWLQQDGSGSRKRSKSKHSKQKLDKEREIEKSKKRRPVEDETKTIERMKQVAEAFAGAGGAEEDDFMSAKMEEVEAGLPEAKDLQAEVLPGWGKWDGAGVKPKKSESAFARAARQRLQEARKNAVKARKDAKLNHVILDQRRIKQAAQLTMAQVPFPFAKREEWEMEVRTPICKELMAGGRFEEVVKPRVSKTVGTVIEPLVQTRAGKQAVLRMRSERAGKRVRARRGLMR
ncbi:hypothetical protein BWQ96_02356 [Gracilariopsis chorda]|uniref:U3 small nucleolar RNA-associated protein 14-like n=1 Tax=Gracilariopsis chorda TaxID=448386 RepID=A0A2V3J3L1_9FLOR|nr:hypothetical protein BWQ96_02356 [Gracilariopsis chorda]|eukprot:PXF47970.1 hypothetical protein BWQ96_02356 [Gracilariopsis chorda]